MEKTVAAETKTLISPLPCVITQWWEFEFKSEVESRISQSHYIHTISSKLCKKGDYWVVWILNSHVHDFSITLIPNSSTEGVIRYGDLI